MTRRQHRKSQTRFLVAGSAITEQVTHHETGLSRTDVGGVAGQIATALARHGLHATLVTTLGSEPTDQSTIPMLNRIGVTPHHVTREGPAGSSSIQTRYGEPVRAKGKWPQDESATELVGHLLPNHDWLLLDCNHSTESLRRMLQEAREHGKPAAINCTTKTAADRAWQCRDIPKKIVTANRTETARLASRVGSDDPEVIRKAMSTQYLLTTLDQDGWTLHGWLSDNRRSPATEPPNYSDFVGCGDYATAGLCHAIANELPIVVTVNDFVRKRLALNTIRPKGMCDPLI